MCLNYKKSYSVYYFLRICPGSECKSKKAAKAVYSFQIKCDHEIDILKKKKQRSIFILASGGCGGVGKGASKHTWCVLFMEGR